VIEGQANHISQKMLGNTERVLIEGLAKDGVNLQGRAENNRVIHFKAPAQNIEPFIGKMADIQITEVLNYTLRGELVEAHAN
jgi:tRNA-2-methylthio-N6-dimethylallyladenosine synthase